MIFRVLTILIFVINHSVNVYGQISIDSTLILIEKTRYSSADSSYKILQNLENNKVTSKQKNEVVKYKRAYLKSLKDLRRKQIKH